MRHIAVEAYCTVREQSIQRKSTFGASRISYQAGRPNFSRPRWQLCRLRYMLFLHEALHTVGAAPPFTGPN